MNALSAFLHPTVTVEEQELVISKRFLGEDGKPVPFKIRSLTQEENSKIIKAATKRKKIGNEWQDVLDKNEYDTRLIIAATVSPDFQSAELCEHFNTKDPLQVPGKMLFAGEYVKLGEAITKLSGFGQSLDDEAKN